MKHAQTLANSGNAVLAGGNNSVEMGQLHMGDADNNNCVSINDQNILRATFAKALGDPGYDARADFNGDNVVNLGDFNLLRGNFGFCGANPISVGR